MQEIKKIDVLSVLKVSTLFGILMGIISGVYMYFIFPSILKANPELALTVTTSMTLGAVLIGAIVQFIMVVLVSVFCALLYNLFAVWVGGIKVECADAHTRKK
jgi:Mg/Co/Ni transporter MgtE